MFHLKNLLVRALPVIAGILGVSAANAQNPACYTLASLQGDYAIIGNYGANVAIALGTRYFDGNGNMTGTAVINEPTAGSTTGDRTIVTATQKGTYTVNCDGSGVITRVVTASTGVTANQMDDFIITGATVQGGQLIAATLVDAQRVPSAIVSGGIFLTRSYTLRPARQTSSQIQTMAIARPKNIAVTSREIQLDGSQSTSADGKPLTYLWTIPPSSPSAAILHGTTATPTVQFTQGDARYMFQLTVTDSTGNSSTDLAMVDYYSN